MSVAADAMRRRSLDIGCHYLPPVPNISLPFWGRVRAVFLPPPLVGEGRGGGLRYNHRSHGEYPVSKKARARLTAEARSESLYPLGRQDAGFACPASGTARRGQPDKRGGAPCDQCARQGSRKGCPPRE